MRARSGILAALIIDLWGCHPTATVQRTMPIANLQTYKTLSMRVQASPAAQGVQAVQVERAVAQKLSEWCAFRPIGPNELPDVILDLNITGSGRGGGGFVTNPNMATIETLLVLSDGQTGDLLGTARINGKSSGMIVNNSLPENEAIDVVAKTVADILAKSGCSGPRIAKVDPAPPPPTPTTTTTAPPDESHRKEAEAINEEGKVKLRSADLPGALAAFQQANSLLPDARYQFNVCLAFEAQQQWDSALGACKQARTMNPTPSLVAKIDKRIDLLTHHP